MYDQSKAFPEMIELIRGLKTRYNLQMTTVSNEGRELTTYRVQQFKMGSFIDFFVIVVFLSITANRMKTYIVLLWIFHR